MIEKSIVLSVKLSGNVDQSDLARLAPEVRATIDAQGSICMLLDLTKLQGEEAQALKSELDLGETYGQKIDKMAIVGKSEWMSLLAKFANARYARQAKYFDADSLTSAWEWLRG